MSLRYAFRVLTAVFLIATMLGTGQSFAQEDVPAATPVVDSEDSFETAESTPDQPLQDGESSTLSPQADTSRPFTISGTVTDTSGTALKDADVCFTLYSPSSTSEKCDVSDENGQYSVDGIPGFSSPRVTVTLDGYWTAGPVFNYFTDQDVTFDVVLQAVAGSVTIAGLVTDTEGEPLNGAEICVRLSRYPQDVKLCQLTGTDGTYSFDNINIPTSTTWILILATMPGYVDTYQGFESLPSGTTHVDFSLSLFWSEQVTVQGVLTDTDGNALTGASIWLNQQCRNCLTASTSTLGDGSFLISDRFDNSYPWVLTIRLETEQCAEFNGLPLDLSYPELNLGTLRFNCETGEITVEPPTVAETITISGQVTDEHGNPLSGVAVCVRIFNVPIADICVSSGTDGNYILGNVPDGEGLVWAYRDGFEQDRIEFSFPGGDFTFDPVLQSLPLVSLSGQITDAEGTPLSGVRVCTYAAGNTDSECVRTSAQGLYTFSVRPDSAWRVFSGDAAWSFDTFAEGNWIVVTDGDVVANLVATPNENPTEPSENAATLVGTLVDINGTPINQFRICETVPGRNGTHCDSSSGETNQFEWSNSDGGWFYDIRIHVQDCPITFVGDFSEVAFTPGVHDLGTFTVDCEVGVTPATSTISGTISDFAGNPAIAAITLTGESGVTAQTEYLTGEFTIPNVPDGTYTLTASGGPGYVDSQQVIVAGADIHVDVVLKFSAPLVHGQIIGTDAQPIPGAEVCLNAVCVNADEEGMYIFSRGDTHIGEYTLKVSAEGFIPHRERLSIRGDVDQIEMNILLTAQGSFVSATCSNGTATVTWFLTDTWEADEITAVAVNSVSVPDVAAGSYSFPMIDEGSIEVKVTFFDGSSQLWVFDVQCTEDETPTETVTPTDVPTETPAVTPTQTVEPTQTATATVTPTESPVSENTLIVTINLPDGASIEGAPYNLYAEQASIQFQTDPIRSGVVGADNTIEINDLLPGTYKLVISPEGMAPIEAMIEIGDQPLIEIRLTVHEDGSVTVEDTEATATTVPTEKPTSKDVSGFPNTGTGTGNTSMGAFVMLVVASCTLLTAGGLAMRQRRG